MSAGTFLPRNQWGEAAQLYVRLKLLDLHQELEVCRDYRIGSTFVRVEFIECGYTEPLLHW
jgi:hypothetical protein